MSRPNVPSTAQVQVGYVIRSASQAGEANSVHHILVSICVPERDGILISQHQQLPTADPRLVLK